MIKAVFAAVVLVLSVSSASAGDGVTYTISTPTRDVEGISSETLVGLPEITRGMINGTSSPDSDPLWVDLVGLRDEYNRRYYEETCVFDRGVLSFEVDYCVGKAWEVMAPLLDTDGQSDKPADYAKARAKAAGLSEKLAILRKQVGVDRDALAQVEQMIIFLPRIESGLKEWGEALKFQEKCESQTRQTCG